MTLMSITDFSLSTITNIFSAFLIFMFGFFLRYGISAYRFRDRNKIWKPFLSYGTPIPTFIVDKPGSAGSLGKVSLTDVEAFSDLRSEVERVGGNFDWKEPR